MFSDLTDKYLESLGFKIFNDSEKGSSKLCFFKNLTGNQSREDLFQ